MSTLERTYARECPSNGTRTLVIDRTIWARKSRPNTYLLNPRDGYRCCLGFACQMYGVPDDVMSRRGQPCFIPGLPTEAQWMVRLLPISNILVSSEDVQRLISINDDWEISDEDREAKIADIFAQHDIIVEFVN